MFFKNDTTPNGFFYDENIWEEECEQIREEIEDNKSGDKKEIRKAKTRTAHVATRPLAFGRTSCSSCRDQAGQKLSGRWEVLTGRATVRWRRRRRTTSLLGSLGPEGASCKLTVEKGIVEENTDAGQKSMKQLYCARLIVSKYKGKWQNTENMQ